ncbi:DNA primase [Streptomyces werraensis]|uniref:DNA primase n=1 Tax=Streptomyces werraensis TaxID=68284 RepID=UPI003447E82C
MNRTGLGLAVGAGYLLGRTKKLKMALAVGGLVAGKKLNLSPRAVADLVSQQLRDNPQFKELGDQLRGELRGAGKAASGALVERQISSLADRLHGRTAEVRGRLSGGGAEDRDAEDTGEGPDDHEPDDTGEDRDDGGRGREPDTARTAKKAAKKAPAKKGSAAKKAAPAKRAAGGPAKKAAAKKTAAKKTASASRGARPRPSKGGGE